MQCRSRGNAATSVSSTCSATHDSPIPRNVLIVVVVVAVLLLLVIAAVAVSLCRCLKIAGSKAKTRKFHRGMTVAQHISGTDAHEAPNVRRVAVVRGNLFYLIRKKRGLGGRVRSGKISAAELDCGRFICPRLEFTSRSALNSHRSTLPFLPRHTSKCHEKGRGSSRGERQRERRARRETGRRVD